MFSKLSLFLGDQAKDVGLIVSQRVLNLPPQLLPPLYDALFDEVSWATEDEVRWMNIMNYFQMLVLFSVCRFFSREYSFTLV